MSRSSRPIVRGFTGCGLIRRSGPRPERELEIESLITSERTERQITIELFKGHEINRHVISRVAALSVGPTCTTTAAPGSGLIPSITFPVIRHPAGGGIAACWAAGVDA
ncbi:MAG TPA: hypothetical protein VGZ27_07495 [Vicinamibacterales bacterium]|nr:hypothetical protein [Vicinamibacterales bacterium]